MRHPKTVKLLASAITLSLMLGMVPAMAAPPVEAADSVYRNANIYTVDEKNPNATAIAIKGDKLSYVGTEAGVEAFIGPNTKVSDLGGKTMLPGLIEGHMHIGGLGESLLIIDAFWKPKAAILSAVAEAAKTAKPGEWIQGRGWMNTVWDDPSYPTKEDLDAVAPNNPVYLTRADGHMAWVNSKAFELAKITKSTPNPQGGEYLKTDKGELLGCTTDTASGPISKLIPDLSVEKQQEALLAAQAQLFSYGITSAMDAGVSLQDIANYKALYESGKLKLRTYPLVSLSALDSPAATYLKENKPTEELYNNHMLIKGVKLFSDGSLGARSAAMLFEYSDRAGHTGNYRYTDDEMNALVKYAYDYGYQLSTHAIGDGANHQMINAYEKAMKANPREDPRMRIEHFQIVTPADIERTIKLGIIPSMQYTHATSDLLMAEDRVGSERIKSSYAWRTILDLGATIPGGSDAPVELVNPYHGLYAGVTRMTRGGDPAGGWYANQKVTREEALKSFTLWAAFAQFEENIKGSLEVGKLADFVVIDRDYMKCPEADLKDIQALLTVSGGEVVYTKDTSVPTVMWNGLPLSFHEKVFIENGTTYAPAAALTSGMSATMAKNDDGNITVTYKDKTATVPARTVDGKDYVAVRALFSGLGYTVTWYPASLCVSTSK